MGDYHAELLLSVSVFIFCFSITIYLKASDISAKLFSYFSSLIGIWSLLYSFFILTEVKNTALTIIRINHSLGLISSFGFTFFAIKYVSQKVNRKYLIVSSIIIFVYIFIIFLSNFIIPDVYKLPVRDNWGWIIGNYYLTYPILIIGFWYFTLNKIYRSSKHCSSLDKINHLYMFWGLLLGIIPPVILNIILPFFNIYGASWTGPIFSSIWIFVIGFSIMRFQQMNVRLVIIEIIAIAMSALLFINIFINARIGRVETFILFVTFLSLSITLVKTVISEVKSKQQLKLLNETLDQKVKEQTAEISEAYEKELESRKTLEKLNITKNQFIMITQHGIRTPINSIKQQLNKIIKLIPKTKQKSANESLSQLDENVARLESINDDFVNLANSNSNEKILNLEKVEPLELIDNVIKEHNREIKQKKISVTINRNQNDWPSCFVDKNKLYNALSIFIENAVHYNKRMGQIIIDSKKNGDNLCIQIIDNGHGLTRDEVNKLNLNHFYRSEIAKEYNPNGMGVGINVGRAIIIAHHGSLKIDSLGPDAGVTIEINIPLNFINSLHIE